MLLILSPAKSLDLAPAPAELVSTQPQFLKEAQSLVEVMRSYDPDGISSLMSISADLGKLNFERFLEWVPEHNSPPAKQACMIFRGDVYQGLSADSFNKEDLAYAQEHLRILSGLYGLLRPLDLIHPYRLEMGTRLRTDRGRSLYDFWGDRIANSLSAAAGDGVVLNLASQEYSKAARLADSGLTVCAPEFKDLRGKDYKIISFYTKRARGAMASWVIRNRIDSPEALSAFDWEGYAYSEQMSRPESPVFLRDSQ
jgi:cytoplasmic iron level regulating protein YaaA (DUF328/UPF0246 family)